MSIVHAIRGRVELTTDQRAATVGYTGTMGYVARPHGRFLTSWTTWLLTLLALVSALHVEGKSRLEGLQHDMRTLDLDIEKNLMRSRSTGDPCVSAGALDQGDSEQLLNRDLRDLAFLCHEARDFIILLAVKSKKLHTKIQSLLHQLLHRKMLVAQGEACRLEWQVITAAFPCWTQQYTLFCRVGSGVGVEVAD